MTKEIDKKKAVELEEKVTRTYTIESIDSQIERLEQQKKQQAERMDEQINEFKERKQKVIGKLKEENK